MTIERKILIVDDEPDILEFLSYNFKKNNFRVTTAANGIEGIEKATSEFPELIISDILMPEMDGLEMCKSIRNHLALYEVPFIFLTAVNDDYKVLHAMSVGADQYVCKPIRFEYLLKIVNQLLEAREELEK